MQITEISYLNRSFIQRLPEQALVYQNIVTETLPGLYFPNRFQNRYTHVRRSLLLGLAKPRCHVASEAERGYVQPCTKGCSLALMTHSAAKLPQFNCTPSVPFVGKGRRISANLQYRNCLKSSWSCKSSMSIVDLTSVHMTLLVVSRGDDNPDRLKISRFSRSSESGCSSGTLGSKLHSTP